MNNFFNKVVWVFVCLLLSQLLLSFVLAGESRTQFSGTYKQGGLVFGLTEPGSKVEFSGKPVRVSERGDFLVGFHRDETSPVNLRISYPDGRVEQHNLKVEKREYNIQRIDGVPDKTVNIPESELPRIKRESAAIKKAKMRDDARTDFITNWQWPAIGPISGVYGSQRVYNGVPKRPHYGVDIAMPAGTAVYAPASGIVTFANLDTYFSGGLIILDHGHHLNSSFLHLSKIEVKQGQRIEQGDKIGEIGATGRATGPHLDWRMNLDKRRIDPVFLVGEMPLK